MYQFVIPVHHVSWSTRSVLEGIYEKYKPKHIYVITSENEIKILKDKSNYWKIKNLTLLDEDNFFLNKYGLQKMILYLKLLKTNQIIILDGYISRLLNLELMML